MPRHAHPRPRPGTRGRALTVPLALTLALAGAGVPVAAQAADTYTNPVSRSFADTYADPALIQAKDGYWYAYATADPLRAGDAPGIGHISRTKDFASWEYLGTIFDESNRPSWAEPSAGLWAPDIRYIGGRYVMYFTVTDTTLNAGEDSAIGVATAPAPQGPWTPTDEPIIAPRPDGNGFLWTFDPSGFTSADGRQWLYYGSYYGGLQVVEVSADGLTPKGSPTQIAIGDRYEGAYVVEHDGWYYLMGSSANCCAGPATGYSVFAGRSRSPQGPFLDAEGLDLNASVTGGTTVLTQNGNRWIGAGHHAVITDATGADFIVYHALDRHVPWLTEPLGINRRPMLMDRLDWIDGWPRTRAGAGPSSSAQPLPVTASLLPGEKSNPTTAFTGLRAASDPQGGTTGVVDGRAVSRGRAPADSARLRLDVRGNQPLTVTLGAFPKQVRVTLNPSAKTLTTQVVMGNKVVRTATDAVRAEGGWRTLNVEVSPRQVYAEISAEDLKDPMAKATAVFPGFTLDAAPVTLESRGAVVDNVSVQTLATENATPVPTPSPGEILFHDTFDAALKPGWAWVRPDADITVKGGDVVWPLKPVDLVGTGNTGALLLRDMPNGNWIAETELTLDLGENTIRNYQQAGMVVHNGDDDFARLGSVAIWRTRTVEYGRELAAAPGAGLIYAGAIIGAPAPTMKLRISHTTSASGEHVYRAGISRDGASWVWGAAWTMPAGTTPRVGLYAGGGDQPAVSAKFHTFTVYRSAS